jgi:hypothetical protein
MSAADRLINPFSVDGSSKRAVRAVLALLYGVTRVRGAEQSEFFLNTVRFRMTVRRIHSYVGNRMAQFALASASAFKTVVGEIGKEIWDVWEANPNYFAVHPAGMPVPRTKAEFHRMFQVEMNDANSASVVSSGLGIPILKRQFTGSISASSRGCRMKKDDLSHPNSDLGETLYTHDLSRGPFATTCRCQSGFVETISECSH